MTLSDKLVRRRLSPAKLLHFFGQLIGYAVMIGVGFVFIYPIVVMISNSFKSPEDLLDPSVFMIPTKLYIGNFKKAFETLNFNSSFLNSLLLSVIPAIFQTISTALIGFGFARFEFPLKRFWLVLSISTFIIPSQITLVPRYVLFYNYGITNTPLPFYLTALFGQGLKSAIFILVYYQFFSSYPKALDEAAELDGVNKFKLFYKIAMPIATPATVLGLMLSFAWYWNETTQSNLYFGPKITTLPLQLQNFASRYQSLISESGGDPLNEAITLAGTSLSILPLTVVFIALQRRFVESIERAGITGE